MKDMSLSASESKDTMLCCAPGQENQGPKYPWGLEINLDDTSMKKLGLELPKVGSEMGLTAVVKVTRVSESEDQDSTNRSASLQITMLDIQGGEDNSPASKLYG